ncbi:hypothetical protein, partial [Sphingomonas sp.]|uniref:hypothetical protein n=1 Tax=Sphingomonas sp. TaxID=28214 RepID=UPI00289ED380
RRMGGERRGSHGPQQRASIDHGIPLLSAWERLSPTKLPGRGRGSKQKEKGRKPCGPAPISMSVLLDPAPAQLFPLAPSKIRDRNRQPGHQNDADDHIGQLFALKKFQH